MSRPWMVSFCLLGIAGLPALRAAEGDDPKKPAYGGPAEAARDPDFPLQGEYVGQIGGDGDSVPLAIQVIALGEGKLRARGYLGGLPGQGWNGEVPAQVEATRDADGSVTFRNENVKCRVENGSATITTVEGQQLGTCRKIQRKSPTLGKQPPAGAVVLFDGTSAEAFQGGRLTDDGLLMEGVTSKQKFGSCTVHLEFRTPFMPRAQGQQRGNSGCYLQGRYEVQILDSFGLEGKDNECGGIYTIAAPRTNMCFPPLSWQTYDIDFTAAKYDDAGNKVEDARLTVRHNGELVHSNVAVPGPTRAAPVKAGAEDGPLYLQNHGDPVRFRNIWVLPKDGGAE